MHSACIIFLTCFVDASGYDFEIVVCNNNWGMEMKKKRFDFVANVMVPHAEVRNISVRADAYEEAESLCKQKLQKENIIGVSEITPKENAVPAIVFLAITTILSFIPYFDEFKSYSFRPDLKTILFSAFFYLGFILKVKGPKNVFKSKLDTLVSVLFVLVFAAFIQIFIGGNEELGGFIGALQKLLQKFFPFLKDRTSLVIFAIVLSLLGIKQISGFIWLAVIVLGLADFCLCSEYMGFVGIIFAISVFLGLIFYLKYEGEIVFNSFRNASRMTAAYLKSNIDESQKLAQAGVSAVSAGIAAKAKKNESVAKIEQKNGGVKDEK